MCYGFFIGVVADVGLGIRFLRKETAWQVAPWLGMPGGAGQGLPVPSREDEPGSRVRFEDGKNWHFSDRMRDDPGQPA